MNGGRASMGNLDKNDQ